MSLNKQVKCKYTDMREYKSKFFKSDSELFNQANTHSHQLSMCN